MACLVVLGSSLLDGTRNLMLKQHLYVTKLRNPSHRVACRELRGISQETFAKWQLVPFPCVKHVDNSVKKIIKLSTSTNAFELTIMTKPNVIGTLSKGYSVQHTNLHCR
eukprot:gnl/TRDRNA2_/TRDRNA2_175486_c20_seq5.p2 gnl/TRDRNA2_/TRDRNA2_175486_c20~~gnl/TRDRNA2_/TRDRNA2_175486_c20_seq5.p2  ORF type:complete len:109 (-),score=8.96 gnl/TRDRNA2_/TRDRNA2_175486_c20_seq5:720-1046(-)